MPWWKGSAIVAPENVEDGYLDTHEERRGLSGWVRKHPVLSSVGITLLILGIIAVIVVPITCSVHGCPPKKEEARSDFYEGSPLRFVVSFLSDVDIADLVPPVLQKYTSRIRMALSNLQILEAENEAVLNAVMAAIKQYNQTDIQLAVRDFIFWAPSILLGQDPSILSGRRLQETTGLNDPGLSSAYWFDKINVTGAWKLLGVNMSNPQMRTSDVIIAVPDSSAMVNHPDLIGSFWNNPDEIDGDMVDNDNNTFIDDVYGACFSSANCSFGSNSSRCGIGRNTSSWNFITDTFGHGTKIAGVIGARPNNGIGIAGVAPNLRQMILKVSDESMNSFNPKYAYSDIVRAVDYAYGKGARIFSMSFGPNAVQSKTSSMKLDLDNAAAAYRILFSKYNSALFVTTAGNEWTDLETWRRDNYTYAPCMVDAPNSLCVGGSNINDTIFYIFASNRASGSNWGADSVDMAAPGQAIYVTNFMFNFSTQSLDLNYGFASGTSFSTPMVAAAGGLVLAALGGQTRATSQTPQLIKNFLISHGDLISSFKGKFKSSSRLNVGNAVAAAQVYAATNRSVVRLARSFNSTAPSVALQGWEYSWWNGSWTDIRFDTADNTTFAFVDSYVRGQPTTNFNALRYNAATFKMRATAMAKIDIPGFYSLQFQATNLSLNRWQLKIGETILVWNNASNSGGTVELIFPDAGYYDMTLWMFPEGPSTAINFLWRTPLDSATWASPSLCWILNDNPSSTRHYDPNYTPKPALWHVVWNESTNWSAFNSSRAFFLLNKDPWLYRTAQTTVSQFSFNSPSEMTSALYSNLSAPTDPQAVVYGYARANLRPTNFTTGMSFRLQGPHTRLYINGQVVADLQSNVQQMTVSPCLTLQSNVAHEIFFYFATRVNSSNPVGLTWAPCNGSEIPSTFNSLSSSLATSYFWMPSSIDSLPRGFRCDGWPAPLTGPWSETTPAVGTPPVLTWRYPRDCMANLTLPNGDCRMSVRLKDIFPNITWNKWSLRCFTYYAGSLTNGFTRASPLSGVVSQHLAGVRVYYQSGVNNNTLNYAPLNTTFAPGVYQLYSIEWVANSAQWNLLATSSIFNGSPNDILTVNNVTMILPPEAEAGYAWRDVTNA